LSSSPFPVVEHPGWPWSGEALPATLDAVVGEAGGGDGGGGEVAPAPIEWPARRTPHDVPALGPSAGASWQVDPLQPARQRFWDGSGWTAHVCAPGAAPPATASAELAWTPALASLPHPVEPPPPEPPPLEPRAPGGRRALRRPGRVRADRRWDRRRLVPVVIAAVVAVGAGAAVAGAGVLRSGDQRPQVVSEQAYRDPRAGFALRYPDGWRVLRRDPDGGIRFAIGARGAPSTETNTVSVVVGADAAELPALHTLADQLTESLRVQLPGVRLDEATRTRLADAPGLRFVFRDPGATPPTRIEQYVGQTTSGRPLTVTVTIRETRTAPSARQLRAFVASLDPS
jgi:hypothetical protein